MAAGDGTRYKKSCGNNNCKILSELDNKFLIEFALGNLKALNIEQAFIVVGKAAEAIKKEIGYNYSDITVSYINQPIRKGIIHALIQAIKTIVADDVVLQLADEAFVNFNTTEVAEVVFAEEYDFLCGITYESNAEKIKSNYSVSVDKNLILKECTEKPHKVINNIKGTGFCVFDKQCIQLLSDIYDEEINFPCDLCDYMNLLISSGKKGKCICVADREFNINEYSDLTEAAKYYIEESV